MVRRKWSGATLSGYIALVAYFWLKLWGNLIAEFGNALWQLKVPNRSLCRKSGIAITEACNVLRQQESQNLTN
jgi:hypothetical protein